MSDTPRTDAEASDPMSSWQFGTWVKADFAETLERELAAKDVTITELKAVLKKAQEFIDRSDGNESTWAMSSDIDDVLNL